MSRNQLQFKINHDDHIIFSSRTIPTPINELTREQLQRRLKKFHIKIFDNLHVSGHGGKEDIKELIKLLNPEHVIPSHGDKIKRQAGANIAEELGYTFNKTIHLMDNSSVIELK